MNHKTVVVILLGLFISSLCVNLLPDVQAQGAGGAFPPCVPAAAAAPAAPAPQGQRQGQRAGAAPAQPASRDAAVTAIAGIVGAGAKWTKVWQAGGNSADGIVA